MTPADAAMIWPPVAVVFVIAPTWVSAIAWSRIAGLSDGGYPDTSSVPTGYGGERRAGGHRRPPVSATGLAVEP